jgi:hypothetical protein
MCFTVTCWFPPVRLRCSVSHFYIERLKELLGLVRSTFTRNTRQVLDIEHWMANPQSFIAFADMALSLGKSRVVVLSGDVHYSFSVTAKIASAKSTVEVLQLTSSALKNEESEIRQRGVRLLDNIEKTASLALWWARGDTNIAILNDYTRLPLDFALLKYKYGEPLYRVDMRLAPFSGSSLMSPSLELRNSSGMLRMNREKVYAFHSTPLQSGIVRSNAVE